MAKNEYVVNSARSLEGLVEKIHELYGGGNYLVFSWRSGKKSSMSQKALVHIWFRQYVAHLYRKSIKSVTDTDMESIKRSAKIQFYQETNEPWMVERITDPFHPDKSRLEVTSIADWEPWQCHAFMNWLQTRAAQDGLILESMGEYENFKDDGEYGDVGN